MPHALLLSPDDQAVSAITGVLEEMSVTCERPLDGPSAAKKLNSQSFDLVLVDCENLPAAKLIFDVCRRSQTGTNPVPIAIVDGRAGLPTAFRLGAELILTKPVAKDQARTTIRTAVNRVRKDETPRPVPPLEAASPAVIEPQIPETRTQAAAASAVSSLPRSIDIAPPTASAEPPAARMHSAVDETAAPPAASKPKPPPSRELHASASVAEPSKSAPPLKAAPVAASDDPVLADLESDLPTPVFTSYKQPKEKKVSGGLVALLLLVLAGGGFYAAWMYQPGFREMVRPLIERVLDLVGTPRPHQNATPARPEPKPTSVTTPAPIAPSSASPVNPAQASAASPATGSPDSAAPASQASAPTTTETTPVSDTEKPTSPTESKKNFIAAIPSDAELPGEKTAVILSSQGADKRLIHHVQATYPAEARKEHVEGTVVLKAIVSESGKVDGVRLVEGNPTLAAAAIRAVKQWRYRPYLRDGKPRPFQTVVLVEFQRP